jgi:DNA-directed RNA polymerase specialized sigma24 family protein
MAERPYAEIAEIMDVPAGTVKTYIHRGKLMLKRALDGAVGSPHNDTSAAARRRPLKP